MRCGFLSLSILIPASLGLAFPSAPIVLKPEDFLLIQKGTLPIIISAPHGGRKEVPGVPERLGKGLTNFHTVLDANTAEIAETFAAELEDQLRGKPWLVVARFERKFIDANRSPEEGCESEKARPLYDAYHGALEAACKAVKQKYGRGLLLDLHGQGEYRDAICRGTRNSKTVTLLKDRDGWPALTGRRSVLGYLQRIGYKVLPNCEADEKTREPAKFNGGYIIDTYGSHTGHAIDAIQLEIGSAYRAREKDRFRETAKDLATAVAVFHDEFLATQK
jgi:N-formylglutamate amidohydrolase